MRFETCTVIYHDDWEGRKKGWERGGGKMFEGYTELLHKSEGYSDMFNRMLV